MYPPLAWLYGAAPTPVTQGTPQAHVTRKVAVAYGRGRGVEGGAEERLRAWMIAAQDGDTVAYELLLQEILPGIRHLVALVVREPAAEEDVVQNVLLSLHRARRTYLPHRPFGPWLRSVTRNAARDALRARARRLRREVAWSSELLERLPAEPARASPGELSPLLREALATLPPAQREAVELLHLQDLSIAEAASRTGTTPGALKLRAHRAMRSLRGWLEGADL